MNYYYLLALLALVITMAAQILVSSRYSKYKGVNNNKKVSGFEVAKRILDANNLSDVYVVETKGYLSDHYDSDAKVIRLSGDVFHGESIAAAAVAAHEVGHAIQHNNGNLLIKIRKFIFPLVNFSSKIGYVVILIGLFSGLMQIFYAGIILLATILLFQLVTLPVEFDASKKAMANLEKMDILDKNELDDASKVLKAAALTYVAGLASTIIEIVRLLLLADRD